VLGAPIEGEASPRVSRARVVLAVTGEHLLTSWQKLLKGMSRNMQRIGRWTARGARVQRTLGSCILGALLTFGCGGGGSPTVEDTPSSDEDNSDTDDGPGRRGDAGGVPPIDID